jgi:predicted SAM-dependent methyltransferase
MKYKKLNLGSGLDYRRGWVNMDNNKKIKADIYADLEKKLPFKKDTFDYVCTWHVLEHVKNLAGLMAELKRICKNGAIIEIRVPHASAMPAHQDPTHVRFFTYTTMDYFTEKSFYDLPKFKLISKSLNYVVKEMTFLNRIFNPLINMAPRYYERLFSGVLPCGEVRYKLMVIK